MLSHFHSPIFELHSCIIVEQIAFKCSFHGLWLSGNVSLRWKNVITVPVSDVESNIFDRCRKIFLSPAARRACGCWPLHHHDRPVRQRKQRSSSKYLGKFKSWKPLEYCRRNVKVTSRMFLNLDVDITVKRFFIVSTTWRHKWSRGEPPLTLDLGNRYKWAVNCTLGPHCCLERTQERNGYETEWVPNPV